MVNAILWQAKTGSQWRMLPGCSHRGARCGSSSAGGVTPVCGPRPWRCCGARSGSGQAGTGSRRGDPRRAAGPDGSAGPGFHDVGGVGRGRVLAAPSAVCWRTRWGCRSRCVTSSRPHDSTAGRELLDEVLPELPRVEPAVGPWLSGSHTMWLHLGPVFRGAPLGHETGRVQAHRPGVARRGRLRTTRPVATPVAVVRGDRCVGDRVVPGGRRRTTPGSPAVNA